MLRSKNSLTAVSSRHIRIAPAGVVEAGAAVPGLVGDIPGGSVVPVNSGTVPADVGPVLPVLAG